MQNDNRVMYYGLSMYGGWYAELLVNDSRVYLHENTLNELRKSCETYGVKIERTLTPRWDN